MLKKYNQQQVFDKQNFSGSLFPQGEYEECTFTNCDISEADLSGSEFTNCVFNSCNCSLVKVNKTSMREIKFKDCKILGVHFENCNPFLFAVEFENCTLNLASFYRMKIKKTKFRNCSMQEVDFTEADISNSILDNCDLQRATFDATLLEGADLSTAYNFIINPETNKIRKAKFSMQGAIGLLQQYDLLIS